MDTERKKWREREGKRAECAFVSLSPHPLISPQSYSTSNKILPKSNRLKTWYEKHFSFPFFFRARNSFLNIFFQSKNVFSSSARKCWFLSRRSWDWIDCIIRKCQTSGLIWSTNFRSYIFCGRHIYFIDSGDGNRSLAGVRNKHGSTETLFLINILCVLLLTISPKFFIVIIKKKKNKVMHHSKTHFQVWKSPNTWFVSSKKISSSQPKFKHNFYNTN